MFLVISSKESSIVILVKYEREYADDNKIFNMYLDKYRNNELISIAKPFINRKTECRYVITLPLPLSMTTEVTFNVLPD